MTVATVTPESVLEQAVVLHQQLQVFPFYFWAGFPRQMLPFISPILFSSMFRLFSCYVPWPLAILLPPPAVFTVSLPLFFALPRSLLHVCRLPAFLSVPACFVFRLACSLSQFHLLGHGFVSTEMWAEKPRRFYYMLFSRTQLAGLCGQEGLLTWAKKSYDQLVW